MLAGTGWAGFQKPYLRGFDKGGTEDPMARVRCLNVRAGVMG